MTAQPTASGLPLDLEPELTAKGYSQFHQIGAGGMGTIVYARKESLDREVATVSYTHLTLPTILLV